MTRPEESRNDLDLDELGKLTETAGGLGELIDDEDEEILEAYCVKCRQKVEMADPEAVWTSKGTPGMRGTCPDCSTTIFRMGKTRAHEGMVRPAAVRVESGTKIALTGGRRRAQPATYINYAQGEAEFARKLAANLETAGIHTWIDSGTEPPPEVKWAGGVHPALRDSARMVAILSTASLSDPKFAEAWKFFKTQKKPIVLVILGTLEVPDPLRRSPRFAFIPSEYQKSFRQLVSALSE